MNNGTRRQESKREMRELEVMEGDGGGADDGAVGTESAGDDAGPEGEVEAAAGVELGLRGVEERQAEAERDGTRHHREWEVEQVRDRRDGAADEPSATLDHLGRRLLRSGAGD